MKLTKHLCVESTEYDKFITILNKRFQAPIEGLSTRFVRGRRTEKDAGHS